MEEDDITSDEEIEFKFRRGRHMTLADIQASLDQHHRRRMSALIHKDDKKPEPQPKDTDQVDGEVKPTRPKSSVGVLRNCRFDPPRVDALRKATEYRLLQGQKAKRKPPTVTVKRTKRVTIGESSGSESEAEHTDRSYLINDVDHGPGYFDPSEDYDFDCEDTPRYYEEEKIPPSVTVYKSICKSLHVTPSNAFIKMVGEKQITLRHHLLGDKGTKAIAVALVDNLDVMKLHLEDNDMRSEGAKHIAEMLRENNIINHLVLVENNICSQGLSHLTEVLCPNENIVKLDLSGNNLDEHDTLALADLIEENTIIKDLNLSHNAFREKGGAILAHALCSNDAVETLNLSWNHLRRKGAVAIAECLAVNISLTHLDISWNGFYLDGCRALGKALRTNNTLEELNLNCNRIDFECLMELLKGISANSTLTCLKLANNPISTEGSVEILKLIKNKPSIKINNLDISTQSINVTFLMLYEEIRDRQVIHIKHGVFADQDGKDVEVENMFTHEDPMMVLMELMRVMHLRLIDLFSALDKDQSRSLTKEEFKAGLMRLIDVQASSKMQSRNHVMKKLFDYQIHVPLSEKAVERLVKKLDSNGDGEVDFGELLEGQKLHKLKLRRLQQLEEDLPFVETELGRIHIKLQQIMSSGRKEALKKAQEDREQRAKDRLIATGLTLPLTPRSEESQEINNNAR